MPLGVFKKDILLKMKNLSIGLVLMISLFGCANSTAKHQDKFLAHIHENTPNPYKECMVKYIKDHWDEVWKTYNTEKLGRLVVKQI